MLTNPDGTRTLDAVCVSREYPSLASAWYAAAGVSITDEFLEWPADLFALTDVLLRRSDAYRFVFSPPSGSQWPPSRFRDWPSTVADAARQWSAWVDDRRNAIPTLLAEEWSVLREHLEMRLQDLAEGRDWRVCEAVLTLHAIADEACAGLGVAPDRCDGEGCIYRARGRELLAQTGSLSRIPVHFLRVFPKFRTPPTVTSLRDFSRYACVHASGVEARWHKIPARRPGMEPRARHANLLLLPWPLRVRESDFRPVEGSAHWLAKEPYGLFQFAPSEPLDLSLVSRMIVGAREEVDSVDVVMLPESAIDETEVKPLEALLEKFGVTMLVSGVRQSAALPGQFPGNWVHIGISSRLEKASSPPSADLPWFHIRQNKHHPWSLDENQVYQYNLGGMLHPRIRWSEAMDVPRRAVQFMQLGEQITLVCLVCEDLGQIDDVASLIRSTGPGVVLTPLLDGPQLGSRWAARYASVLADDPGSAVLTLTSYGMVQRCRPNGRSASPVVALWKDPVRGTREIPLESDAQGILITVCGDLVTRRTADGRSPVDDITEFFGVAVHQVRAASAASETPTAGRDLSARCAMDVEELTVLTGWVEAVAEVLACAPAKVETLLKDARAGAWRNVLRIKEPTCRFGEAIDFIGRAIQAITYSGAAAVFDDVLEWSGKIPPEESALQGLTRRVLRSAMEAIRIRKKAQDGRC